MQDALQAIINAHSGFVNQTSHKSIQRLLKQQKKMSLPEDGFSAEML